MKLPNKWTWLPVMCSLLMTTAVMAQTKLDGGGAVGESLGGDVKPGNALRITIDGSLKLTLVSRNDDFFRAALGDAVTGAAGAPLGRSGAGGGTG